MQVISTVIIALFVFSVILVPTVSAASTYMVDVITAYDEEFRSVAQNFYWYSPSTLIQILFNSGTSHFWDEFQISFQIVNYLFWDSNDAVTDYRGMLDEVISELGFTYNQRRILVAFTDQLSGAWGASDSLIGAVLVKHAYPDGVGQATDNIIQHEISHLYRAEHHWVDGLMCVMNVYPYWIDFPYYYHVPTALVTNYWCTDCINIISSNRNLWGYTITSGGVGGGGGGQNHPRGG